MKKLINPQNKKEIPIFFASDDNYLPFLDVTLVSLIENASKDYFYSIHVLNVGLNEASKRKIKRLENENFSISFVNASRYMGDLQKKFKNVYHFSLAAYYRLFIQGMFPQYKKILYLDCDIAVLGDISELYNTDLEGNMIAAVKDGFVPLKTEFINYVENAVGVPFNDYINSGILVVDLEEFRKHRIEQRFTELLCHYNFDTVDPDQAYINYFCRGKIKYLPSGWNKTPAYEKWDGKLNIVHYALAEKPWNTDVPYGEIFWHYAKKSAFYNKILKIKDSYTEEEKLAKELAGLDILKKAIEIVEAGDSFLPTLGLCEEY